MQLLKHIPKECCTEICLKRRIHGLNQGDWLVATYFHKLHNLWQELDNY
jgi:hypothetical protein